MPLTVLFCADPRDPRRPDPHFAREAASVRAIYGETPLIGHDALQRGDLAEAVRRVPRDLGPAWYRGWMVTADQYEQLAAALDDRGTPLITLPADYRRAHELPGWHDTFAGLTPSSVWLPLSPGDDPGDEALEDLVRDLPDGGAVVKDYVKSRKHEWDEACFVPDLRDIEDLHRVVTRMIELQDDFLAGGIVVRAYESYLGPEARVWWVDGEPALIGPHPDTPRSRPTPVLDDVRAAIRALGCRFITTDLALRDDETWRVVEVGDGQVSDLASSDDPLELYEQLPGSALF
jgi:ATP-grasp domain, R2K clade family 3